MGDTLKKRCVHDVFHVIHLRHTRVSANQPPRVRCAILGFGAQCLRRSSPETFVSRQGAWFREPSAQPVTLSARCIFAPPVRENAATCQE